MMSPVTARIDRAAVIAVARSWIGTPYHHQASRKGIGCDCLGLVRGVWRELYEAEAETPPPYTRDWGETGAIETMLEAAARHLGPCDPKSPQPGDVLVFRLWEGRIAKHAAIVVTPETMVHAVEGARASEVALSGWWRRRIAGAFTFPGV